MEWTKPEPKDSSNGHLHHGQPARPPIPPRPDHEVVLLRLTKLERQRVWLLGIVCLALAFGLTGLLINRPRERGTNLMAGFLPRR
jgi:hypothetical protein